jgi:aminoglycoside phosphotransferase (APT) family kinase protein
VGSVLSSDRGLEFYVLGHVARSPVPSPLPRYVDPVGTRLGRPSLIMDLAIGRCDYHVLNGPAPLADRLALAQRIYDLLADIHLLDTAGLELDDPGAGAALAALGEWERQLRAVQLEPEPELTFVIEWLRHHARPSDRTVLVHGDFKPGNLLLDGGTVSAVLDWETAHLGDPHEDLGWVTNPLRSAEHRIPGAFEPGDLLARWSARTGWAVDPERLRWWQILANLKLSVIVLSGVRAFCEGRLDRLHQSPVAIYRLLLDQIGS